jgi:hypothetical protein
MRKQTRMRRMSKNKQNYKRKGGRERVDEVGNE